MADTAKRTQIAPLPVSQRVKTLSAALMFVGIVTFIFMLMRDKIRAWHGYLVGYFYFFLIAIGGLFFTAILEGVTSAGWSVNVRRICESFRGLLAGRLYRRARVDLRSAFALRVDARSRGRARSSFVAQSGLPQSNVLHYPSARCFSRCGYGSRKKSWAFPRSRTLPVTNR